MDDVEHLVASRYYRERVIVMPKAMKLGRSFSSYYRPEELLRAVQAVLEAAALYHDDRLGEPPKEFFNRRGFGYSAAPMPHLKVDEATSRDQCLRIYWEVDETTRLWTITEIGYHR